MREVGTQRITGPGVRDEEGEMNEWRADVEYGILDGGRCPEGIDDVAATLWGGGRVAFRSVSS